MDNQYDVIVLGLGAMGSAALYQLSKTGQKVLGIDMYSPPHKFGSSFGESRVTRQAMGEGVFYTPIVLRANEIWQNLENLSGEKLFNRCGVVIMGYEDNVWFQNTLQAAKKFSIEHKVLERKDIEHLFPTIRVAPAQENFLYYYEPTSGYLIPEKCIDVQLKVAKSNGAGILVNTKVKTIEENSNGIQIRLDNNEILSTSKVIVALGSWMKNMFPEILTPILKTYLQTLYWFDFDKDYYNDFIPGKMPVILCGDQQGKTTRSFYGFPAIAGKEGGVKFALGESNVETRPEDKDGVKPLVSVNEMYSIISRYIKHIKPNTLRTFNCLYTSTPDENFVIDFAPDSKRIIIASPCSGHGFKHSAAIGEILSELAVEGKSKIDIQEFSFNCFKS
jgi:sarcosine oxidase